MDEKICELENLEKLRRELLLECLEVIKNTPTNHAHTTYQLDLVEYTLTRTIEHFRNHYGL